MWLTKKQHSSTTKSLIYAAFPERLRDDVIIVLKSAGLAPHEPFVDSIYRSKIDGGLVTIPYRVYFPPTRIADIVELTAQQQAIFAAIMTRHYDGHQREYWARVLCSNPFSWTAPYLAAILGDYVIQVLEAVRESLIPEWEPTMMRYASENKVCIRPLNHRIINYWTIYYRYSSTNIRILTDYPGYIVANELGLWDRRTAPKLIRKAKANKTLRTKH